MSSHATPRSPIPGGSATSSLPLVRPPQRPAWARLESLLRDNRQILMYAAIGSSALTVDLALYLALTLGLGWPALAAHTVSVPAAVGLSFALNASYNFKQTDQWRVRLAWFAVVAGLGYLAGALVIWSFVEIVGGHALMAKLVSLPPVFALQYRLNSRITFGPAGVGAR